MPRKIAESTLNASTVDILNVIRQNSPLEYQNMVPKVLKESDIPKVGEVLYGHPAMANQFLNALVNRIVMVRTQSATFYNPYVELKKGYIDYGETIEDIFVGLASVFEASAEKAESRELKRYLPDVRSAFHIMNWQVIYPVTIQDDDLRTAFLNMEGVQDLIARIVDQIYTAASYDEFLLFKYLIIKKVSKGALYPVDIGAVTDLKTAAVNFRGTANLLPFISNEYNEAGVKNNTPKSRQVIFMDAKYNATFDVELLSAAFNMDKADFMGRLHLIDSWTTFDNDRWTTIRANSDMVEEVTDAELALMANVKAVLMDSDWFQVYDNLNKFTVKYVASGPYWNYFYHVRKTVSTSPYANAIVFCTSSANAELPDSVTVHVDSKSESEEATVLTFSIASTNPTIQPQNINFLQTATLTATGIGIQRYGAAIIPASRATTQFPLTAEINGVQYTNTDTKMSASTDVDDTFVLSQV